MSWFGYKAPSTNKPAQVSPRTEKRNQLQAERLARAQQREKLKKQLKAVQEAKEEADLAEAELFALDPEIFEGTLDGQEISEEILDESTEDLLADATMVDFEAENADDSATAMDNLRSIHCPFNKEDLEFWFSQLEDQLTLIGVKKQWTKKIALVRFLPPEIQIEVKSLLTLKQTAAGTDIYLRIKNQLLKLYGPKPEDSYMRAKSRVLTGKPSQLGKLLVGDICPGEVKLEGCHCARQVWGMFREKIPVVIRNHIADMPFDHSTYEAVFDKADQVWDSNSGSEPLSTPQVAAATKAGAPAEQAAIQRPQRQNGQGRNQRNKNKGQSGGGQSQNQNQSQKDKSEE